MRALRRWTAALLAGGLALVVAPPSAAAAPGAAAAAGGLVAAVAPTVRPAPAPPPADLGGAFCLPVVGCDPVGNLGQDAAHALAGAIFSQFGTFVADGVQAVLHEVALAIGATTQVTLDAQWFRQHVRTMCALALLVLLPMVLVGLIGAVIRRDASQLVRAGVVYVPVAILGGLASVELTERALQLTDWATRFATGDLDSNTKAAFATLGDAVNKLTTPATPGVGMALAIVVLLVLLFGALLIWIELLLRADAIYVVVLFLPIAMSGLVWRATANWTRRMVEVLVALLLSKFVIVVVIDLAAGMIVAGDGIGTVMQGATLLLLAGFAPFALLRLVPIVEAGVIGHLERLERRPVATARATLAVASQLMGGIEAAGAGKSVAANGGDAYRVLSQAREPGGQLNDVRVPEGWTGSGGSGGAGPPGGGAGPPGGGAGPDGQGSPGGEASGG